MARLTPDQFADHLRDQEADRDHAERDRFLDFQIKRAHERHVDYIEDYDQRQAVRDTLSSPPFHELEDGAEALVHGVAEFLHDRGVRTDFDALIQDQPVVKSPNPIKNYFSPPQQPRVKVWTFLDFEAGPRKVDPFGIKGNRPTGEGPIYGTAIDKAGNQYTLFGSRHRPLVRSCPFPGDEGEKDLIAYGDKGQRPLIRPLQLRAHELGNVNNFDNSLNDFNAERSSDTGEFPPFVDPAELQQFLAEADPATLQEYAEMALRSLEVTISDYAAKKLGQ